MSVSLAVMLALKLNTALYVVLGTIVVVGVVLFVSVIRAIVVIEKRMDKAEEECLKDDDMRLDHDSS